MKALRRLYATRQNEEGRRDKILPPAEPTRSKLALQHIASSTGESYFLAPILHFGAAYRTIALNAALPPLQADSR